MLSIKPIGSSGREVSYYAGLGQEDYYVNGGEPPGRWCGAGARHLKLAGQVEANGFRNILLGQDRDGRKLVQNAGDPHRRAAFDLTWSVPKSVSVARSQADEPLARAIDAAAEAAVNRVFETVQELCGVTRRGHGGERIEQAGLVAAVFRHDTARGLPGEVPDPHQHFHMVIANVCVREDGSTGTFDARPLFQPQMKMALGALFRAELSRNLEAIGLTSHRPVNDREKAVSWFELDAIPKSLVKEFSKRRQQIEHWLRKHGQSGGKAAEQAALATRLEKERFTREELSEAWKAIGKEHGLTSEQLTEASVQDRPQRNPEEERQAAVKRAVELITDDRARFSELELLRYVAQESQTRGLGISEIQETIRHAVRHSAEIVLLQSVDGIPQYTTQEMLAVEARMLTLAERTRGDARQRVSAASVAKVTARYSTLRDEQTAAVRHLTTGGDRISCVNGMAGTGKTFLLAVAREVWQQAGFEVVGTALAAKAAQTLHEGSGIQSTHLHRLLSELSSGRRTLNERTVVVLDEAGMVGTRMMEQLLRTVESSGAKLVLIGDHRQLQAINAGAPFRVVSERLGVMELKEITRQREKWARKAVQDLARGEAELALREFVERGQLVIAEDRDDAIEQLVRDWHKDFRRGIETRIFAGTRLETSTVNRLCQHVRYMTGALGDEFVEVGSEKLRVGDRVMITKNERGGLLKNGMTGEVSEVDRERNELRVRFDGGLQLRIDVSTFDRIELGYCTTTHKGQGQTVESAFVLAGGAMTDREISYVQGSRARGTTRFYTDVLSGGPTIEMLAEQMSRSRQKDLAHEYLIEAA